jgi:hypothetical protein
VIPDAVALVTSGLMVAWWISRFAPAHASRIAAGVLIVYLVPVGTGLTAGGFMRGFTGDLSLVNLGFLVCELGPERWRLPRPSRIGVLVWAVVVTLTLIPFSHGLTMFDPYAWGYDGTVPAMLAASVAVLFFAIGLRPAAWILVAALAGFHLGLHESRNVWDCLVDPFLALQAAAAQVIRMWQMREPRPQIA